jgi:hypothetical protein
MMVLRIISFHEFAQPFILLFAGVNFSKHYNVVVTKQPDHSPSRIFRLRLCEIFSHSNLWENGQKREQKDFHGVGATAAWRTRYFPCNLLSASFSAVASASAAFTFTSGSAPVPSQFVFEMGLTTLMSGTRIMK